MKRFLINNTSNVLSAVALGSVLLLAPAPAKANEGMNQLIQMLQVLATLEQTMNGGTASNSQQPVNNNGFPQQGNTNTSLSRCGYFTNVEYSGAQAIITKMNRCTGEVVERTVKNRYND